MKLGSGSTMTEKVGVFDGVKKLSVGKDIDIEVHFKTSSGRSQKSQLQGGMGGTPWDDGANHDGVKKITVGKDIGCISYIKIEYEKDGKLETQEYGIIRGETKEFSVNFPNENIIAVSGSFDHVISYNTTLITSLFFKTSTGRTSPKFGETSGKEFILKNGGKLLGLYGRGGPAIYAIGAYFNGRYEKSELQGGKAGDPWDHSFDNDGVKTITVGEDTNSISYVKIQYVKDSKLETHEYGVIRGEVNEFSLNYPNEIIIAVGGSYNYDNIYKTTLISSLFFTTSAGRTSITFGYKSGTEFVLKNGGKLLGFYGRSGEALDAIGAYFKDRYEKSDLQGGRDGDPWDHSFDYDGVKKVTIGMDTNSISYIKIEYEKDGKLVTHEHGLIRHEVNEFSLNYPNETIVAVGGSYNYDDIYKTTLISSLFFKTSTGRTSITFGNTSGTEFILENGGKLLGFYGLSGEALDAIGAYFETS